MCIGWCADQVTLRSARCNDKDDQLPCCGNFILSCVVFVLPYFTLGLCWLPLYELYLRCLGIMLASVCAASLLYKREDIT